MFKSLLLLILLACKAPNVADNSQAQPRLIDQELDHYVHDLEESSDDFRLQLNEQGLVKVSFLKIAGKEIIKDNAWQLDEQQKKWRFAWKSWQGDQTELLWLELIEATKLQEKQGFHLTHMGIPLQAHGDYSIEVNVFQDKEIIASQKLQFKMNTQRYYGGGVGGQLTHNHAGVVASVFAVDPQQASVAFVQTHQHGHFYLKYKYSGNYRVFAFNDRYFGTTEMLFREFQGSAKVYHDIELDEPYENISQSWLLTRHDAKVEKLTDARSMDIFLAAHTLGKAVLIGAIAQNGRLSWQYFKEAHQKMSLEVDSLIYNDPQAILFVLQQGKVPFSRWLNKDSAASALQSMNAPQAFSVDDSTAKETIDLQLDVSKQPDISMQRGSFIDAGSSLLLSASASSGIRSWHWFINGSFFGSDLSTIYQVPDDYEHDKLFIRVKVDDHWGNTFEREYHFAVRRSGLIWEADTPAPYWLAAHGLKEQKFLFRAQFIGNSDLLDEQNERFHWYLEKAEQPHNPESEPHFSTEDTTPLALHFTEGGFYRLRVELADAADNTDALRLAYESEFLVNSPLSGLEIKGSKVAEALSKSHFSAVVANLDILENEQRTLSYTWYIDDKLVQRFPEFIELSDDHRELIYHNKKLRMQPEEHLLRLEVNDGFYPETLQTEYSFSTEAVKARFEIISEPVQQDPDHKYLLATDQLFTAVFQQAVETIDTASLEYSWSLFLKEDAAYKKLNQDALALWQEDKEQLLLNFLEPGSYRLEAQAISAAVDSDLHLEDELFFRVNAQLTALDFQFNKKEIAAAETLVLEAKVTNIEAQILDQDQLRYRWFYWKNGQFDDEERFELDAHNLAAGFSLVKDNQLELRVDPLLAEDSEWQFQVEVSDHVYPESLSSAKETFQFKKSDWSLSLETPPLDHYRLEQLLKVHAQVHNLAATFEQPLVYQWKLELFDEDKGAYRPALLKGVEAQMDAEAAALSLVFSAGGSYRLSCSVELKGYENSQHLRTQELIFDLNHRPEGLELSAASQILKAGESLKIEATLANLEAQIAEKDTLTYRWQHKLAGQFQDIDFNHLPPEFQFNDQLTELELRPSFALGEAEEYSFRLALKDSVYKEEIESNILKIKVEPADIVVEIEHLQAEDEHVFLISQAEEFKALIKKLPAALSNSFSYLWSVEQLNASGVYESLELKDADTLASNFHFTPKEASTYLILLQAVYSSKDGQSRTFNSDFKLSVRQPLTKVHIQADAQQVKVGESLSFKAISDLKEQNDALVYRWQLKTAAGDFVDLVDNEQWILDKQQLHFKPLLELAQREAQQIRVVVDDTYYPEVYSQELEFTSLPLDLVLSIQQATAPFKLDTVLNFSAHLENRIPELKDAMLTYLWQLYDAHDVEIEPDKIEIIEDTGKDLSLKFKESDDYRLQVKVSYGAQDKQRELVTSLHVHINQPPQKLTLSGDKTTLNAGETVKLNALLSDVQQQLAEGDKLSYRWQLETAAKQGFQDLSKEQITFPARFSAQENSAQLHILPSLAQDEIWKVRAIVADSQQQESISQMLDLKLKAAAIKLDIVMPQGLLKLGEHSFSAQIENLPPSISYGDLSYLWELEQQNAAAEGSGFEASERQKNIFTPNFQVAGDYLLQLRLTLGKEPFQRQLSSEKKLHIDHPAHNLSLQRQPATGVIQAGDQIEFKAVLENLELQKAEGNSLTWLWEQQDKNGVWQLLQASALPQGSSINEDQLVYQLPPTLNSDGQKTLRVSVNDGVYTTTLSSAALSFDYQAVQLEPQITLPQGKLKINEALAISSQFLTAQLPRGVEEKDLHYLWFLEQQDFNGDWRPTSKGFSAVQMDAAIFQPTFSLSGDYRLNLELSFKLAEEQRKFLTAAPIHINQPPQKPVLKVLAGSPSMKAGESLELQASIANQLLQDKEGDALSWIWWQKDAAGGWEVLKTGGSLLVESEKLSYRVPPTLAQDERRSFKVQVSDQLYPASDYSKEFVVDFKAAELQPSIKLAPTPYKIAQKLRFEAVVDENQLPVGLNVQDLSYLWKVQTPEGLDADKSFIAASSEQKLFKPQFEKSGDYILHLSVSFGSAEKQRLFNTSQAIHLNNRPATPILSSTLKEDFAKAGASFELKAQIANAAQEEDKLSWMWELKKNKEEWQLLDAAQQSKLASTLKLQEETLTYSVPATLKQDESISLRVKVSDAVYQDSAYSQAFTLKLQASRLKPAIIVPQGALLIKEPLHFKSEIDAAQLPQGLELKDLRYNWQLEKQDSTAWQPLAADLAQLIGNDNPRLGATFQKAGVYRLRLSVAFGTGSAAREFSSSKEFSLNHPPATPVLKVLAGSKNMKAGELLELEATIANQLLQDKEGDTLSWIWQQKTAQGNWQDVKKDDAAFTLNNHQLSYHVAPTLTADTRLSLRVQVSDQLYTPSTYSQEFSAELQAAELQPSIKLAAMPCKIAQELTFEALVDESQLPLGVSLQDLSYLWQVDTQDGLDASKSFTAVSSQQKIFEPQFQKSGDYRLTLRVSFGKGQKERSFNTVAQIHVNQPPQQLTLSSDKTTLNAGGTVELNALLSDAQQQLAEGDTLNYRWQLEITAKQGFQDLSKEQTTFPARFSAQENSAQLHILPSLAQDEVWKVRAIVSDSQQQESVSQVLELKLKAAAIKLDIVMPQGLLKLGEHTFTAKIENLPQSVSYGDLSYLWELEQQNAAAEDSGFEASERQNNIFKPSFKIAGDYLLRLRLTLGKEPFQRQLSSEKKLHIDHPAHNLSLQRQPATGVMKAGDKIELKAVLENLALQQAEGNSLTWLWEQQNKEGVWQLLQASALPQGSSMNEDQLAYQLPPTLNSDGQKTLRISVNDGVYTTTLSSAALSFDYQAVQLEPQITLPQGKLKMNEALSISSQFLSDQLPRGVEEKDLHYLWFLEQQDFNGDWRPTNKGFSAVQMDAATFQPTFSLGGDYRLNLELSFKLAEEQRKFLTAAPMHVNQPPQKPVLKVLTGSPSMKAGESLELQASVANQLLQDKEGDALSWIWWQKDAAGGWEVLKTAGSLLVESEKLSYRVPQTLAQDERRSFKVQVSDQLYPASDYSKEFVVQLKAAELQPSIKQLIGKPYKLSEALRFEAVIDENQLPVGLNVQDLSYLWKVQTPEGLDADKSFTAVSSQQKIFKPQFEKSGDYILHLSVSFGSAEKQRLFNTSQAIHLNNRPATPILSSTLKADFVKAGARFELKAQIANAAQEEDKLSWMWELKKNKEEWQLLDAAQQSKLASTLKLQEETLTYSVPATLKQDESISLRVKVSDAVYQDSAYSQAFTLNLQASRLTPAIIFPQGALLIKEPLHFKSEIDAAQLPQGLELKDLRYNWQLEKQDSTAWQPLAADLAQLIGNDNPRLGATFQEAGVYRLHLSVAFGTGSTAREFSSSKEFSLNHPPTIPVLKVLAGSKNMKAGESLQLEATIANQLLQDKEGDTLSWNWQQQTAQGNWQDIKKDDAAFTLNNHQLSYHVAPTLTADTRLSLRVQVSDQLYTPSTYSQEFVAELQAAELQPSIKLAAMPYKIAQELTFEALVDESQLPLGLSLQDLSYLWQVDTQDGLDASKSFTAVSSQQKIFEPQFQKSGDYRLTLRVSFGKGQKERSFNTVAQIHVNQPPQQLTLSSDKTTLNAGGTVELNALLSDAQQQLAEGDTLNYRWQLEITAKQGFQDLSKEQTTFPARFSAQENSAQLHILPSLAQDEVWKVRAIVSDSQQQESVSQVLELKLKAAAIKLDIVMPQGLLKLGEHTFPAKIENLPQSVSYGDLSYLWELEQQNAAAEDSGFEASERQNNIFKPSFKIAGDYLLRLRLTLGKEPFQRQLFSEKKLHIDHPAYNLSLQRQPATGVIQAGDKIEFKAVLENLALQQAEGNSLTWLWEQQNKEGVWQLLQASALPQGSSMNEDQLAYQLPPTLNSDGQKTLRISVNDGVYTTTLSSAALSFDYQAVQLEPQITLPQGKLKMNEALSISSQFLTDQLPRGVEEKDLHYLWFLEQQDFNGDWRPTNKGFNAAPMDAATFQPTFSLGGDYRLNLELSFKLAEEQRKFLTAAPIHINQPPQKPVLKVLTGSPSMKAGESLELQASVANQLLQDKEGDALSWIWWQKDAAGGWEVLKTAGSLLVESEKLSYRVPPTLAQDEKRSFKVQVSDQLYPASDYSKEFVVQLKAAELQPSIKQLIGKPYKLSEALRFEAVIDENQLPVGLNVQDLSYLWKVQTPEGLDADKSFTAVSSQQKIFKPQFEKSGDYILHLSVSFGSAEKQRLFNTSQAIHLNNRPATPILSSTLKADFVKAGARFELKAQIANAAQEEDKLSWMWELKKNKEEWQLLDAAQQRKLASTLKLQEDTLSYSVPATLKQDESISLRVKVSDAVYQDSAYSKTFTLNLQASRLTPAIIFPQGALLIKEPLHFKSEINAAQLPQGLELKDLRYSWQLEKQDSTAWQPLAADLAQLIGNDSPRLGATFQEAGVYRLRLSVAFGTGSAAREFSSSKEFSLNHPPATPVLKVLAGSKNMKAGELLELEASIANQLLQDKEGDTLSWIWQQKTAQGNWQDVKKEDAAFTLNNHQLSYHVAPTLTADTRLSLRVQVSDQLYAPSTYSQEFSAELQAAELQPSIKLAAMPYKIAQELSFEALVDESHVPLGLSLQDLSYLWQVDTQDGLDASKSFTAVSSQQETFEPQFKESGDYRITLSVSFGKGQKQRHFNKVAQIHVNQPPQKLTLSSDKTTLNAGETVKLNALLSDVQQQLAEGDKLNYRWRYWQHGQTDDKDAVSLNFKSLPAGFSTSQEHALEFQASPALASNEEWLFQVGVRDSTYTRWLWSKKEKIVMKSAKWQLSLTTVPEEKYILDHLYPVDALTKELPPSLQNPLNYEWSLQVKSSAGSYQDAELSGHGAQAFLMPQDESLWLLFFSAAEYRLNCQATFKGHAKEESSRTAFIDFKVNAPPQDLSLKASKNRIEAGKTITLDATLANLAQQNIEGDQVSYRWQQGVGGKFEDIAAADHEFEFLAKEAHKIRFTPAAALAKSKRRIFRVSAQDNSYKKPIYSPLLFVVVEPADIQLSIEHASQSDDHTFLIDKEEKFKAIVKNLPAAITEQNYQWQLQIAQNGSYVQAQQEAANKITANSIGYVFTLKEAADYRLLLKATYKDAQAQSRSFEKDFKFRVNHPPSQVEIASTQKKVTAGQSLQLRVLLNNAEQQKGDTLSYTWQEESAQGVFHDIQSNAQWLLKGEQLSLKPPLHLAKEQEKRIRVLLSDGHYKARASKAIKILMQPLELNFQIQVPKTILKVNQALSFAAIYENFPQQLDKKALNYLWQVLQQGADGSFKEVAKKWSAASSTEEIFQPLFQEGGEYLLRLQLSYGTNNKQRVLKNEQGISINHPPNKLTVKSNLEQIAAGETVILNAHLDNAELQKKEKDRLSYSWQQRRLGEKQYTAVQHSLFNLQKNEGQLSFNIEPGISKDEKWEFRASVDDGQQQKSVSTPLLLTFKASDAQVDIKNPSGTLLSGRNYNFMARFKNLPHNLGQSDFDYTWSIERQQSKDRFIKSDQRDVRISGNRVKDNLLNVQFLHGGRFRIVIRVAYGKKIKHFIEDVSELHINHQPSSLEIQFEPRLQELQAGSSINVKTVLANFQEQQQDKDTLVWTWMVRRADQPFMLLDSKKSNAEYHFDSEQQLRYTPSLALQADERVEFRVALSDAHYQAVSTEKSLQIRALSIEPSISLLGSVPKVNEEFTFQALIPADKLPKDKHVSYHWQILNENAKGEWKTATKNLYKLSNGAMSKTLDVSFQEHGEFAIKLKVRLGADKDKADFTAEQIIRVNKAPAMPRLLGAPVTHTLEAGETLELQAHIDDEEFQKEKDKDTLSWSWQMKKDSQDWQTLDLAHLDDELRIQGKKLSYRVPLTLKDNENRSFRVQVNDGVYDDSQASKSISLQFKAVELKPDILLPSLPYKVKQDLQFQASVPQNKIPQNQLLSYEWELEKKTAQSTWQKLDLQTLSVGSHHEATLHLNFLSAGSYRLKLLVSFQEKQSRREFSVSKELWLNYPPAQLTLERQPASGDIFGGQEIDFLSKMSNLEKHIAEDKDQLAWTWQRAIIPATETLKEDDFELLKDNQMQISYTPDISQKKEKKLYYRLAFSDGVYEVKKVSSKAVLLKPLPIKIKILSDTEDAELLKYRPNKDYQFRFELDPQLPPSVDISHEWSLSGGKNVVTSQRKEPQFSFKGHTKYKLTLLLSYISEGRKRQLNPKTVRININAPPRGVTFHAQQIKDSGQRVSIDTNKYKMLEVASSDKLVLIPTIANLEKQKKEGDKISYRWFEKSSALKNKLVLAQFMPVDLAKAGYEQSESGVLAIDAAKIDLEGKKYRTFSCEAQDDAYQEWKRSVVSLRTNFQITPTNLELKTSMNGHIKSISQNNAQPSPITTLEKTDYSASLYDPDSLIRSLILKNPRQVHGILVFSKDLRASGGGKLKISRQLKLDSPDKDGYRHAHFQLSINRSSALNMLLSLTATGHGKKLQSKFYLQRIDAQPYDIELFQENTKMSHQRAHPSIIPVNRLSGLNSNFTKISHFSLHFKDPNDLVKRYWKLELIEGQQAMLLGNSPYKDIIYSLNSNGKNDEKDGLRHITFNFGFKERSWQGKILQIRASLSSDQGQSYPISKDFYIQRDFFIPSEWKFFEQKAHGLAEEIPSQRIIMKHSQTKEFFVQIKDPDKQIKSLELLSSPVWGDIPTKKVEFGDILDHEGHRRSKLFEISVIANIGKDNTLHFKLHSVSGAIKTPQQAEKSFIITNN